MRRDAAAESRRLRTVKGDKRFFLPKMQVLAKPFKIFLGSRKEFRKDCDIACKAPSGWETTNTKNTDAAFQSIQHLEDAHQCGYPRAKEHLVAASASVKNQLGNKGELQTEALTCLKVLHDAISGSSTRRLPSSVTEEKTAEAARVRRRRIKIGEAFLAANVAKPPASTTFRPRRGVQTCRNGMTQQISHPLSRSSLQTRRREQVQLAACSTTFSPRTKKNRKHSDEPRRQDDKVGRHDTFVVG